MRKIKRQITLNKKREQFIYIYGSGEEEMILDAVKEQRKNPELNIDDLDVILIRLKLMDPLISS